MANPPPQTDLVNLPGDLHAAPVPGPTNLDDFVADRATALALGKALFWDMQVGSDGIQACASCHFRAGADPRSKNQLNPGLNHFPQSDLDFTKGGPNYQLKASDFPLSKLATPGVRGALDPATDNNDVVSSQGVPFLTAGTLDPDGFNVGYINTRRVEPRNTPSVFNAVFNHRQFWDGRANDTFNGVNSVGDRDPAAMVARADDRNAPALVHISLASSSLASQALAPIVSTFEMAAPGRVVVDLGVRLHRRRPLAGQEVHLHDSVLGAMSRYPARGLRFDSYDEMIEKAFKRQWWDSSKLVRMNPDGTIQFVNRADRNPNTREVSMMEYNFGLFFGLAIQVYESTLISDQTPWDKFRRLHPSPTDPMLNPWVNTNPEYISRLALFGAMMFNDRTKGDTNVRCSNCHEQAELTDASARRVSIAANGPVRNREGNIMDKGFSNIGLRPTVEDLGVGASDAFGPLSRSLAQFPGELPATFDGAAVTAGLAVDGAFKVPSLRNVELTAPYFHNGDARTLEEVVQFYSRGGNIAPIVERANNQVAPISVPGLNDDEVAAIVAFLKTLTDPRVVNRQAPFDHPQLFVPNGARGNEDRVSDRNHNGIADDEMIEISAVGAEGGPPIPGFLEGPFGPH
ncbi:MAG TPA: cytochrome c peroxidase [Kofleriaceae bacterium]|nr:cytochrome c peroxidase [Kofleriaceae bacterium]